MVRRLGGEAFFRKRGSLEALVWVQCVFNAKVLGVCWLESRLEEEELPFLFRKVKIGEGDIHLKLL